MGESIKGAPHPSWENRWAVIGLAVASAWAFGTSFGRELARFPEGAESPAKVVVMAPAPPEPGMAPLRTYAVAAPQRAVARPKETPLLLDIPALAAAQPSPSADASGVPASTTASDSAPGPAQPQAQPPHNDPGADPG
jgi:hypothetical protein